MAMAIFRVQGIQTTNDLRDAGKHNLDRVSHTNMDIDHERSHEMLL
ncbi:plasmid recombination protein [Oceanobacillus caeni]|nr:plasmid recombination protein [Oceanobacillus caeni]MCR1836170.1 plasmid recombination protein [Oceanobacillus caeni]